jgi:hypothetical protein
MRAIALSVLVAALSLTPRGVAQEPKGEAEKTFRTSKGQRITYTLEPSLQSEKEEAEKKAEAKKPSDGEHFNGTARAAVKTSIAPNAQTDSFSSPAALLDSLLAGMSVMDNDDNMRTKVKRQPGVRASEENRNAQVAAFIYALKKENDNDYHLIIGPAPGTPSPRFMVAEVSGLPAPSSPSANVLTAARDQFKTFFTSAAGGLDVPVSDRYVVPRNPVQVVLTGSVFFDVDHEPGQVGTRTFKPATVWEVHPVTDINFP